MAKNVARDVSYTIGGVALLFLIAAGVLLALVRNETTVITSTTPTTTVTTSKIPLPPVRIGTPGRGTPQPYDVEEFTVLVSPVVSFTPTVTTTTTVTVTNTPPFLPPGVVPFPQTINMPLQTPAEGMGWCAMLPDASGFFTSFENGYNIVGQFVFDEDKKNYITNTSAYTLNKNRIQFNCPNENETGQPAPATDFNNDASALGSLGFNGIATSFNNLRVYVSFRQPLMGSTQNAQNFPFLQTVGAVAVFTRPSNPNGPPTSTIWDYSCQLELKNPFGSQTAGFDSECDPVTGLLLTSDDFGQIIRPSVNLTNNRPMVCVRTNYGYLKSEGAAIVIYEETEDAKHEVSGILQLFDRYAGEGKTFTFLEKVSFGSAFDVGDNALLAAIRVPENACDDGTNAAVNRVAYFKRNDETLSWEFQNFIETPEVTEDFGTSICMCPDGQYAIVGSPARATGSGESGTPGIGGSVYFYARNANDTWTQTQRFQDPNPASNPNGAFGYFVSVDKQFLICTISSNQDNVLDKPPAQPGAVPPDTDLPKITLVSIDVETERLLSSGNQTIVQPFSSPNDFVDASFGSHVAMAFQDQRVGTFMLMASSPVNQLIQWYEISVTAQ